MGLGIGPVTAGEHLAESPADFLRFVHQPLEILGPQILIGVSPHQPMAGFLQFTVGIREFAREMRGVSTLGPSLRDVGADRARRPPNLIGQG